MFSESLRTTVVDDFGVILTPILELFLTLGEPWEGPWHHPGTPLDPDLKKVQKKQQKNMF